ncbi:ATP-binding cassette domain-containing protein [Brachybacterium sacelli]|uniref:Peptide/nickel transport system ATP-binding protein/oligopeptide transport system ATP-binding protein n=1 Tax=Brachybacterium sacelli TaxID=173364 RepID=A0ABS4WYX0_9MICO|nr:ABC transporter ATP-binding protein [Brachybacterium sacelli]MBP2381316.1 peptide/nickel transport system ATP-binding protein/oligopeptide transport system ATP-binding protein [Brachybacterium sacelli]
MTPTPLLEISDLHISFSSHRSEVPAVRGIDLALEAGRTLALVGESGSGKSSTALSVLRLNPEPPATYPRGRVAFDGTDLLSLDPRRLRAVRGRDISMVFQDPMATLNPLRTVGSQLMEVLAIHRTGTRTERRRRMLEALEQARVPQPDQRAAQYPHQLSGGLRQRVMLAMALMSRPRLLIADEPTTALDVTTQAEILDLLRTLQRETGMGILLITHDLGVVASVADHVAVMHGGLLAEQGDVLQVFEDPQAEYTRSLLAATPRLEIGEPA